MAMAAQDLWRGWDGTRLAWDGTAARACGDLELCIDGVLFERIGAAATMPTIEREFALSPSGCAEIEFALRTPSGDLVAAPWRVLHGASAAPGADQWPGPVPALRPLAALPAEAKSDRGAARTSIIVPIYNSPQLVQYCVDAVLRWSRGAARLILIDDASPDPGVAELLERYARHERIVVHRNAENFGYTRSTNLGIELAGDDDVVFLNSDTEVGPSWLDMLRGIACADAQIGTVTAVSDNAGAFSVPEIEQYCPIPAQWTLAQAQRALLHHARDCLPELPTGNGFCMFVKRRLLERVGILDAQAFPAGYGEENDLCQRAERVGFRHVIAGNVLVRHARSASFGAERRAALGAQGMAVLRARYPDYEAKVGATLWSFARRVLDYRVRRVYADRDHFYAALPPRPRVLLVAEAGRFLPALRGAYDCRVLRVVGSAAQLRDAVLTQAIEFVHVHGAGAAEKVHEAAGDTGIAVIDTSQDALLSEAESMFLPGTRIATQCTQLYRTAWRSGASFADLCDGAFA
jgi:GT2 family glycosyltransferase